MKKLITLPLLLIALGLSGSAFGCQLTAWNGGTGGTPLAGGPELPSAPNADPDLTRYSGECAMEADAGDYVQDDSATAEPRILARFYFFNDGASSGDLLVGYSDAAATLPVFTVSFDSTNVTLSSGAGTAADAVQANWNSVEVEYNDNGAINLWMNADPATATPVTATGGTGTVETVRLGLQNGSGRVVVDSYEARRSMNIGRLVRGDAFPDSVVNVLDLQAYVDEILGRALISGAGLGVAQCTEDAAVDVLDIQCVVDTILGRI